MGKQIRFFMEPEDECSFLNEISSREGCYILRTSYRLQEERVVSVGEVANLQGNLSIYNLALVRSGDVGTVGIRPGDTGNSHLDLSNSPVIQFNRCRRESSWLRNGRLWFQETSLIGESTVAKKDASFCQWARSILDWVKGEYTYLPDQFAYAGAVAVTRASAGQVVLGPPQTSTLSLEERRRILGLKAL